MPTVKLGREVVEFVMEIPAKHARQVLLKCLALSSDPFPQDARPLKGANGYLRVDSREYRLIYRLTDEILYVSLIGKRNDDEVYKEAERKGIL